MAFSPEGVDAHPSPRILAVMFVLMYSLAFVLRKFGNKNERNGSSMDWSLLVIPRETATFIRPDHKPTTPNIKMQSSTASLEEDRILSDIETIFPFILPTTSPIRIRKLHM